MDSDSKRITRLTKVYAAIGAMQVKQIARQMKAAVREHDRAIEKTKQELAELRRYRRVNTRLERHVVTQQASRRAELVAVGGEADSAADRAELVTPTAPPKFEYDRYVSPTILDARNRLQRLYFRRSKAKCGSPASTAAVDGAAALAWSRGGRAAAATTSERPQSRQLCILPASRGSAVGRANASGRIFPVLSGDSLNAEPPGRLAAARGCLRLIEGGDEDERRSGDDSRPRSENLKDALKGDGGMRSCAKYRASIAVSACEGAHHSRKASSSPFDRRRSLYAAMERSIGMSQ